MPRKAAKKASTAVDEPNVIVPLATSYNERGVAGFTHAVTNSEDQRKINCFYELVKNPITGKGTLTLSKRPGVVNSGNSFGSSSQGKFLISRAPASALNATPWIFSRVVNDIRVSDSSTTTVIVTAASYYPSYIDKTIISAAETLVLQIEISPTTTQRVFFSSGAIAGAWTEIVDADFTVLSHRGKMEHMDGYAFILDSANKIWNSDINSLANWTATSFIAKQIIQDYPLGLAKLNNQIIAFGQSTMEVFYNAGNTVGSPLLPIRHLHQRVGLVKSTSAIERTHYYAVVGDRIYFAGRKSGGTDSVGVFSYDGQRVEKISNQYIDKIFSEESGCACVYSVGFGGKSAVAFSLQNIGDASWFMFFPDFNEWFEWTSSVFVPANNGHYFMGGSGLADKAYSIAASDKWQDDSTSYAWSTQFKLPTNGSSTKFMPMYGIDADTDTSANNLTVEISTVDPQVFTTLGTIDQTQDRKVLFEGGSFTKAWIRLGNTNARPTRIHNFLARIE